MTYDIQAQGEVYVRRIDELPDGLTPLAPEGGVAIVAHSEQGHHHVLDTAHAEVLERPMTDGLRILYAIVREPTALRQTAATPHEEMPLAPGLYEMRLAREYDPFAEQIRRVAD
jgi:hypothetical protein